MRAKQRTTYVDMKGGIELSVPAISIPPGAALFLVNFEPELNGGYRRINGYERVDGRAAPSDAVYYTVGVADASGISVGATLTGGTSGTTSEVIAKDGNTLGVTDLSGAGYTLSEAANGTTISAVEAQGGNDDQDLDNQWQLLAEDYYRDLITAVPGSGDILGAVQYGATKYAFRSDGSNAVMYKSSASGWTVVTFFHLLRFDSGVTGADADLVPGATITGQLSSATATIKSIVQNAGAWDGTAAGYMVVDVTSGTFQDAENIRIGGITKCVADGANSAITLSPGGKFQFVEHNYYGSSDTSHLYGCDGVNFAWEFDGEVLTPILFPGSTNPSYNTPKYIEAHTTHLFLSFPGGRLAHSSLGTPLVFSGLMAAAAFGLGAECTGLESRAGQVLAIYTQDGKTYGLYGTDVTNWDMRVISESFGGKDYTVRSLGTVFAIDDQGIVPLERVQAYGDFEGATVSRSVRPILDQYSDSIVQAFTAKDRNQYRVAFSDGTILVMSDDRAVGGSNYTFSTLQYPDIPTCFSDNSDESGSQVILFGDSSGFVYQAEKGYTFDGDEIESVCKLAFIHANSPSNEKRWHKVYTNIEAEWPISTMKIKWETNYATPYKPIFAGVTPDIKGGGGYFDIDNFDQIYFDAEQFSSAYNRLSGRGYNISILYYDKSKYTRPFVLESVELTYFAGRERRG